MIHSQTIDAGALSALRRHGGDRLVRKMIDLCLVTVEQRLDAIRRGYSDGDLPGIRHAAHSLKSSAGIVGARRVQELAGTLEREVAASDPAAIGALVDALEAAYEESRGHLVETRERLGAS